LNEASSPAAGSPIEVSDPFPLGTDGWRGVIADGCTFDRIRGLAAAYAAVYPTLPEGDRRRVVVGYGTRFDSPEFARAAADVLAESGLEALLADCRSRRRPCPSTCAASGLPITASHNPSPYNGFKIKAQFGGSAPPALYEEVARALRSPAARRPGTGRVETADLTKPYADGLAALVDVAAIRSARLGVVADAMHGAAGPLVSEIAGGGRCRIVPFRSERDVLFGGVNPEPIGANLSATSARLRTGAPISPWRPTATLTGWASLDRRSSCRPIAFCAAAAPRVPQAGTSGRHRKDLPSPALTTGRGAGSRHPRRNRVQYVAELMNRASGRGRGRRRICVGFHLPERDASSTRSFSSRARRPGPGPRRGAPAARGRVRRAAYDRWDFYLPITVIHEFSRSQPQLRPRWPERRSRGSRTRTDRIGSARRAGSIASGTELMIPLLRTGCASRPNPGRGIGPARLLRKVTRRRAASISSPMLNLI
jgi:hypothetical protein